MENNGMNATTKEILELYESLTDSSKQKALTFLRLLRRLESGALTHEEKLLLDEMLQEIETMRKEATA